MRFAWAMALLCVGIPASAQQQDYSAANADRQAMLDRLGIKHIRPGADGFNKTAPNAANYDEARAGNPELPPLLRFADGKPVKTAREWTRRRAEIVEAFDREIYGRVPVTAPSIRWRLVRQESDVEGGVPVVRKWLEGVADNAAWPQASARILLRTTLPRGKTQVPVILSFALPDDFKWPGGPRPADPGPPYTEQLLQRGWGYARVIANSIQADNGGLLKDGVIGISVRGRPRTPEDWGVLRAWGWGASRAFDALASDPAIDVRRIGI